MKKLLVAIFSLVSISAFASDWQTVANSKEIKTFLTNEVGAEGRHQVKIKEVQKNKSLKNPSYRVFAVVENSYHDEEENTSQNAVSCDTIYIVKGKQGFEIQSWSKYDCPIEDLIFLKQL